MRWSKSPHEHCGNARSQSRKLEGKNGNQQYSRSLSPSAAISRSTESLCLNPLPLQFSLWLREPPESFQLIKSPFADFSDLEGDRWVPPSRNPAPPQLQQRFHHRALSSFVKPPRTTLHRMGRTAHAHSHAAS